MIGMRIKLLLPAILSAIGVSAMVLTSNIASASQLTAGEMKEYSQNDIYFYDPSECADGKLGLSNSKLAASGNFSSVLTAKNAATAAATAAMPMISHIFLLCFGFAAEEAISSPRKRILLSNIIPFFSTGVNAFFGFGARRVAKAAGKRQRLPCI